MSATCDVDCEALPKQNNHGNPHFLRSAATVNRSIIMTVNITISIAITDNDNASPRTSQASPNVIIPGPVYRRRRQGKTLYARDVQNSCSR